MQTRKTLISAGTEMAAYRGEFRPGSVWSRLIQYPWQPGYSNVGEIVAVGEGVSAYEIGQRVVSWGRHANFNLLKIAPLTRPQIVPDEIHDEDALFLTLGKTALHGVRLAQLSLGESVLVMGVGILGLLATQFIHLSGGFPCLAVDLSTQRLALAGRFGATHTLVGGHEGLINQIREITQGCLADVAFEITGSPEVLPTLLPMVRDLGRVILLGSPRGEVSVDFHDEVHTRGLQIIGAHVTTHPQQESVHTPWSAVRNGELIFKLVAADRIQLRSMISHRFPWQESLKAYSMLAEDPLQALGVVLEGWDG